ncbi:MAG TPA: methyltransferase domain-containing protein [Anaerolineales bacterium]|nr:methyltransferase domain-containing protein [Anaerolineales bacterium]
MPFDYQRYLLAKRTLDDRSLNQSVYRALQAQLAHHPKDAPLHVLEIGCGIGTMLTRLQAWQTLPPVSIHYTALDSNPQSTRQLAQLPVPAHWQVVPVTANLHHFLAESPPVFDLLIAHAVLDLFHIPSLLPRLLNCLKPAGLAWCTINFDGESSFEPVWDAELDRRIWQAYHRTMDERVIDGQSSGDSHAGRHLFHQWQVAGARVLAVGASDWVVTAQAGRYPADEGYFLQCIVQTIGDALTSHPAIAPDALTHWLQMRLAQVEQGELMYLAHQLDYLVQKA